MFFICPKESDEYFTKFIPNKVLDFFPVSFLIVFLAGQKFKMKEIFIQM